MSCIFIIAGYGIPKDIFKDENYNFYLKMAYNQIWDIVSKQNRDKPIILFCGGKTSAFNKRKTEAGEMKRFFNKTFKTKWEIITEDKSISSLENLLFTEKIIKHKFKNKTNVYIVCEKTREAKIRKLAKEVFKEVTKFNILPVDFDVSSLRYLSKKEIEERHKADIEFSLKALKDKKLLKKHHQVFQERIDYLRKHKNRHQPTVIKEWQDKKLEELYKLAK